MGFTHRRSRVAVALTVALTLAAHAAEGGRLARGKYTVDVSDTGSHSVSWAGTRIVNYEALQLVNPKPTWRAIYSYGSSKTVKMVGVPARVIVSESMPNVLSCTKTVQVGDDGVAWDVSWDVAADSGATANYYFLDIPGELLTGARYKAETAHGTRFGRVEAGGKRVLESGVSAVTFLTGTHRIRFVLDGRNVTWLLTDWSADPHKSFRLRIEREVGTAPSRASAGVRLSVIPANTEELEAMAQQARKQAVVAREQRLRDRGFAQRQPLRLGDVQADAEQIAQYGKFELTFEVNGTYDNPFDPDQIDVVAEFRVPSGNRIVLPAFLYQHFEQAETEIRRSGTPIWKARFTPVEPGRHEYTVTVKSRGQTAASPAGVFTCTPRKARGFIRVSETNPLYCEFENGEPYVPSGFNLFVNTRLGNPMPTDRLDQAKPWMTKLAEAGGNFLRLRMDSWWFAIEMTPDEAAGYLGLGYYHQRTCWEIDRIYDFAAEHGLYVMHCIDNANANVNNSRQGWRRPYNHYLKENGGLCDTPEEFWSHEETRRTFRNKLRYCVARWGYHPHLMSWELWNETVCREPTLDAMVAWHREMGRYLRATDLWAHPITTSLQPNPSLVGRIWELPEMEIVQEHHYGRSELVPHIVELTRRLTDKHGKPFFLGEYGIGPDFNPGRADFDPTGVQLHNGLWGAAFAGGAGAGAWWYVGSYLDGKDLYWQYAPFAEYARHLPWTDPRLRACEIGAPDYVTPPQGSHAIDFIIPTSSAYAYERPPVTRFHIGADGVIDNAAMIRGNLNCAAERKAPPTFVLDVEGTGRFVIRVTRSVGDESNKLIVTVDGKRTIEKPFPAGKQFDPTSEYIEQWDNWRTPYNEAIVVELGPGRHEITPEAQGKDRLEVTYVVDGVVLFERMRPLRAVGLRTDDAVYLWIQNISNTWRALYEGKKPIPVKGMRTQLGELPDGSYRVRWFDTWTGTWEAADQATCTNGVLELPIPEVTRDLACRIEPAD